MTLKQGHTLTCDGPYRFARHPIYTGILLGVLGSAISLGEWRALLALALILACGVPAERSPSRNGSCTSSLATTTRVTAWRWPRWCPFVW